MQVWRRGTRGRTPSESRRTGPPRQGRPFETCPKEPHRSEGSLAAQRADPDVGRVFSLVTFSLRAQRESDSAGGPKPELSERSIIG